MRTPRKLFVAAALAATMALPAAAMAQSAPDTGWYAGGSIGQSEVKDGCSGLTGVPGISCDEKDTAWKIFGGYQLNRNFAAEFGYTDLGEISASGFGVNVSAETTAWELSGIGSWPLTNQFSVFGRLGFYRAETEGRSNVGVSADSDNTGLTFGVGVQYNFSRNLGLRGEWQRYSDVGENGDESDIDVLGVSLVWKF